MSTAVEHAFRDTGHQVVDFNCAREALSQAQKNPREQTKEAGDPFEVPYWGRPLVDWNDTPSRTETEVLEAFRAAAAMAIQLRDEAAQKTGGIPNPSRI